MLARRAWVCVCVQLDCDIASMTVGQCTAAALSGSVGADLSVTYLLRNAEEHKGSHEAFNVLAINPLQLARTEAINLNYNSRQADTCSHTPTHTQTQSVIDSAVAHVVYVLRVALSVCGTLLLSFRGHPLQTGLVYLLPLLSPSSFPFSLPLPACLLSMLFILIHASGKGINRAGHKDARGCQSCCWVYSLIRLMRLPLPLPLPPTLAEPLLIQFTADVPVAFAFDCLLTGQHGGTNYNLSCCWEIYALNLHSHSDLLARMWAVTRFKQAKKKDKTKREVAGKVAGEA